MAFKVLHDLASAYFFDHISPTHSALVTVAFFRLGDMLSSPSSTFCVSCLSSLLRTLFPQTCPWLDSAQCLSFRQGSPHQPKFALFSFTACTLLYLGDWICFHRDGSISSRSYRMCKSLLGSKYGRGPFSAERELMSKARGCGKAQCVSH